MKEKIKNMDDAICRLKIDDMFVEIEYSNNNKSLKECILNILKKKAEEH